VQNSLRRLRTDHLDAFFLHEPATLLEEESWEALQIIRQRGFSRFTGVSTSSMQILQRGLAFGQIQIFQTPVSPVAHKSNEVLSVCAAHGVPVVANETLQSLQSLEQLRPTSKRHPVQLNHQTISSARLLLNYAASQPAVHTVLIGTKSADHLLDNISPLPPGVSAEQLSATVESILA
jgi:aryl-alcohol dehydrogenase-like predicted oxidoreductase